MGSFPALAIQQPESPIQQIGQAMQLKGMISSQQLQAQNLEMGKVQLQQARQAQAEQQTLRELYKKNAGDIGKTLQDAAASGNVSPQTLIKLQESHVDMQTKLAGLDEKVLKNALDSGNLFAGALDQVEQMPVADRAQGVKSQLAVLAKKGIDVSSVSQSLQNLPDWSKETIDGLKSTLIGHNKSMELELKRRDTVATETQAAARMAQASKPPAETEVTVAAKAAAGDKAAQATQAELLRQKVAVAKAGPAAGNVANARSDKSFQYNNTELDKVGKPIEDSLARFGRLQDTVSQKSPQADALVAPELLSVMAGGSGSGLRMNEAEIARIVGGRSNFESLKAALNKWQLDPSKALTITDDQRNQIKNLMGSVYGKLQQKQAVMDKAREDLVNEDSPFKHRMIVSKARQDLTKIDMGQSGALPAAKTAPIRPKGVPAEAVWDEATRTWSMP